jgi:hypothetical protein
MTVVMLITVAMMMAVVVTAVIVAPAHILIVNNCRGCDHFCRLHDNRFFYNAYTVISIAISTVVMLAMVITVVIALAMVVIGCSAYCCSSHGH